MNKLLTIALMVAVVLAGCKKDNDPVIKITKQPTAPAKLTEGEIPADTKLTVDATVTEGATLTYQWYEGNPGNKSSAIVKLIEGATSASYTIPTSLKEGVYNYFCEVGAQGAKAVRTSVVTVTVDKKPAPPAPVITIDTQPTAPEGKLTEGEIPADTKLTVAATVTQGATLTYQWYSYNPAVDGPVITLDGDVMANPWEKIDGATSASYTLTTTLKAGEYYYVCDINAEGAEGKQTDPVKVTVAEKPVVIPPFATNPAAPKFAIPDMTVGTAIAPLNVSGGVSGGTKPYTFSSKNLPAGLTIDASMGIIYGVPTTPQEAGTATVTVTDSSNPAQTAPISVKYGKVSAAADDTPPPPPFAEIIAVTLMVDFDSAEEGYTAPAEQTVKILNVGTGTVTLIQPTATNKYTVGTLSTTELAAGGSATFTVQPQAGLTAGTHNETITVRTSNGAAIPCNAKFTVNADTAKPTIQSVTINGDNVNGKTNIAVKGSSIVITFSEAMNTTPGTVKLNTTTLTNGVWTSNTVFTIPYSDIKYSTAYTLEISGFKDAAGNIMDTNSDNSFTTAADTEKPTVQSVSINGDNVNGKTDIALKGNSIVITFSEAMTTTKGTVKLNTTTLTGGSWTSNTVYTIPYSALNYNTAYTLEISGFKDAAGNIMDTNSDNSFTTVADTEKPTVQSVSIYGNANNLNGRTDIPPTGIFLYITFSEAMNTTTKGTVKLNTTTIMDYNCTWRINNDRLLVCYFGSLNESTTYTVEISGFKDAAGNIMDTNSATSFTTTINILTKENFPDDRFFNYMSWMAKNKISDNDGIITPKEAALVTELDLSATQSIADLTGIEYFTNLATLNCANNLLTTLDLSNNTNLVSLYLYKNPGNGVDTFPVTVWATFTDTINVDYYKQWLYEYSPYNYNTITPKYIKKP